MRKQHDRLSSAELKALARRHVRQAYETIVEIVRMAEAPPRVRDKAIKTLIARGWVKPATRPDDPTKLH
jgi:hypothetical protein